MEVLVVVDMQNDFIDGSLGTNEAVSIVPKVADKIKNFKGMVLATRDTHEENYLSTQEGTNLPVQHCIRDTRGWELNDEIRLTSLPLEVWNSENVLWHLMSRWELTRSHLWDFVPIYASFLMQFW